MADHIGDIKEITRLTGIIKKHLDEADINGGSNAVIARDAALRRLIRARQDLGYLVTHLEQYVPTKQPTARQARTGPSETK